MTGAYRIAIQNSSPYQITRPYHVASSIHIGWSENEQTTGINATLTEIAILKCPYEKILYDLMLICMHDLMIRGP